MNDGEIVADGTPAEVFSQVELLRSVGLNVPETTELLYALRADGSICRWMRSPSTNVRRHFMIG